MHLHRFALAAQCVLYDSPHITRGWSHHWNMVNNADDTAYSTTQVIRFGELLTTLGLIKLPSFPAMGPPEHLG